MLVPRSLIVFLASVCCAFAQQDKGGFQGHVDDDKGQHVSGAYIVATPQGSGGGQTATAMAGAIGDFNFADLKPGVYSVCVQEPGGQHLDPCSWSTAPQVTVVAGQAPTITLPLVVKGSLFVLRIDDPNKVWAASDDMLVGITLPSGRFSPLRMAAVDMTGRTYDVAVAFDTPLVLYVSSSHLLFSDDKGKSLGHTASIPFKHVTGGANARLTISVSGRN